MYKVPQGRIKPKKESTFGKVKKPFKGSNRNRKGSKSNTTSEELDYLHWLQLQNYPCFVCGCHNGIEWHHVKLYSSDKKNHKRLIPLCGEEHHRLGKLSPHGSPKLWRETFSLDVQNVAAEKIYDDYVREKL